MQVSIQKTSKIALQNGMSLQLVLDQVKEARSGPRVAWLTSVNYTALGVRIRRALLFWVFAELRSPEVRPPSQCLSF